MHLFSSHRGYDHQTAQILILSITKSGACHRDELPHHDQQRRQLWKAYCRRMAPLRITERAVAFRECVLDQGAYFWPHIVVLRITFIFEYWKAETPLLRYKFIDAGISEYVQPRSLLKFASCQLNCSYHGVQTSNYHTTYFTYTIRISASLQLVQCTFHYVNEQINASTEKWKIE